MSETTTLTISEFLRERLNDEQATWESVATNSLQEGLRKLATFVLEDIMSKRAIADLHQHVTDPAGWIDCVTCGEQGDAIHRPHAACAHLRLLAAPYRRHEDYREEWA